VRSSDLENLGGTGLLPFSVFRDGHDIVCGVLSKDKLGCLTDNHVIPEQWVFQEWPKL